MTFRHTAAACALAALGAVVLIAGGVVSGQEQAAEADGFTAPRTSWGDPELAGIWSPGYTLTPLERPDEFEGREFLTDEEVAALEGEQDSSAGRNFRPESGTVEDVEGAYNDEFTGRGKDVIRTRRTSLIVDPPNGRIPPRTPEAIERIGPYQPRRAAGGARSRPTSGYRTRWIRRAGATRTTRRTRAGSRWAHHAFVRGTSGTYSRFRAVAGVVGYSITDAIGAAYRAIHLDGRPHRVALRQWLGHSIGHGKRIRWWSTRPTSAPATASTAPA